MEGECEICGRDTQNLDCCFNGNEEIYACETCAANLCEESQEEMYERENAVLDAQERKAIGRSSGGW